MTESNHMLPEQQIRSCAVPAVSVVMPTYNRARHLSGAIESILNQTFKDFEFIIVDDGSSDHTAELVSRYRDTRIRFFQNGQNRGVSFSTNRAIRIAQAPLVARMDSDDHSRSNRLAIQVEYFSRHPEVGILGGQMIRHVGNRRYRMTVPCHPEACKATLLFHSCMLQPTVMIRKKVLELHQHFYDERYRAVEDYELWTRLAPFTRIANIPDVLVEYLCHDDQLSARWSNTSVQQRLLPWQRMLEWLDIRDLAAAKLMFDVGMQHRRFEESELNDVLELLLRIDHNNASRNIFDVRILRAIMADHWLLVCMSASEGGIPVYKKFCNSAFKAGVSLIDRYKLLWRCVWRKQT